jgi:hypothetical protein
MKRIEQPQRVVITPYFRRGACLARAHIGHSAALARFGFTGAEVVAMMAVAFV